MVDSFRIMFDSFRIMFDSFRIMVDSFWIMVERWLDSKILSEKFEKSELWKIVKIGKIFSFQI